MTPPAFERLVKKCLKKDPESRWQSARDLADELRWISQSSSSAIGLPAAVSHRRKQRSRLAWAGLTVVGLIAAVFAFLWFTRPIPENPVTRFKVTTHTELSEVTWPRVSPDGKFLAFLANNERSQTMIWIRPMNSLDAYALAGTENAGRPFWSPDSKSLAFITGRSQMKKISVSGGPAQLVCETEGGADGHWGNANLILFDGGPGDSIRMVPASGGTPVGVSRIDKEKEESTHAWPWFLPDGKHFLYLAERPNQKANYMLKVGDVESDDVVDLFPVDARVEYSSQGYIVFFKDNILQARKFNPETLELSGENIPITDKIGVGEANRAEFGLSETGTLTYQTSTLEAANKLVWIDRKGEEIGIVGEPANIDDIFLSPDESRISMSVFDGNQSDVWIYDLIRNVSTRVTFNKEDDIIPVWDVSGNYIYYSTNHDGGIYKIYKKAANGMGEDKLIFGDDSLHSSITSISKDGKFAYGEIVRSNWDIQRINLEDPSQTEMLINTPYAERGGGISPDGTYLAYHSNESGTFEVYVLQLGPGGGRWQISSGGGRRSEWSKDGTELYYFDFDWNFFAVPIAPDQSFTIGQPRKLFNQRLVTTGWGQHRYDVTSSKEKFLMNVPMERTGGGEFVVVLNWYRELETR
jgi:Tol biopolymer transport system component